SIAKIPLEDIDHDFSVDGLYSPIDHKHVWLDIDQTTVPIASEIERGLIYLMDHLMFPSDQATVTSRALIAKFTEIDAKIGDGNFASAIHKHPWLDIIDETIPVASILQPGIVKLDNSISSKDEFTAATSKAVSDVYDLIVSSGGDYASRVHYHDTADIKTGILPIRRGGTGKEGFSDGFIKFHVDEFISNEFIQIDDIFGINEVFAPIKHDHFWSEILDPPTASDVEAGLVKIANDTNGSDPRNTATSIDLFLYLEDKVIGLEKVEPVDAYTKLESDEKFIGYKRDLLGEYLDYVTQNGLYSSSIDNVNVGEPCIGPYMLEVSDYQGTITQKITGNSGVFIRLSQNSIWSEWAQQWDSKSVKGEATKTEFGFVKRTNLVDLESPDAVPTNEAIRIYVGETTGDSFEPAFQVLQVEKGGTGAGVFDHENGFIRVANSEMYTVEAIDWSELKNIQSSSSDIAGITKVSSTIEHSDDPATVAASLSLVQEIKEDIMGEVGVQAYTKAESDEK
ncbi:MAG: pyocin knob domain-containing protein, partial [Cetobacterium sp.]